MPSIPRLIAEELTTQEKVALRLFGLGRPPKDCEVTHNLMGLRLLAATRPDDVPEITRLGKEVLGEVILSENVAVSARVV